MGSRVDDKFAALRAQGFTGSISDMTLQWLQFNGATSGSQSDAWLEMLAVLGFEGQHNDAWYALLGSLGFEGAISDRTADFWLAGGVIGPESPAVRSSSSGFHALDTSHLITLPAVVEAGDLLVIMGGINNNTALITFPLGWDDLINAVPPVSNGLKSFAATLIADGSEGGTDVTIELSEAQPMTFLCLAIQNTDGTIEVSIETTVNSPTVDCLEITASWGEDGNLFMAFAVIGLGDGGVDVYPTDYVETQLSILHGTETGTTFQSLALATRQLNSAADNPDPFTINPSSGTSKYTLVVKPGSPP